MISKEVWLRDFSEDLERLKYEQALIAETLKLETRDQGVVPRSTQEKLLTAIAVAQSDLNRLKNRLSKLSKELRRVPPT